MILLLDNYDSFTFNLVDYLKQCGADIEVIRNDELDLTTISNYSGIVISPGPGIPQNSGVTMQLLDVINPKIPVLGVCLGMQALGINYGFNLKKANFPMHGKTSEIHFDKSHPMFLNVKYPFEVCRYHSLILETKEESDMQIIAETKHNEVMAIAHKALPLWGVQFHPEAILTNQGMLILQNWLKHHSL